MYVSCRVIRLSQQQLTVSVLGLQGSVLWLHCGGPYGLDSSEMLGICRLTPLGDCFILSSFLIKTAIFQPEEFNVQIDFNMHAWNPFH